MATARKVVETRHYKVENPDDPNVRDPEHAHELGGTLGMTVGGVAGGIGAGAAAAAASVATGALTGAVAGPVGAVIGAAIGGAIGGKAGESIAREVNPTAEEAYWEKNYSTRDYVVEGRDFETYRPAYRHGIDAYTKYQGRAFDEIEPQLNKDWSQARGTSSLEWNEAREASRDAYTRLSDTTRND